MLVPEMKIEFDDKGILLQLINKMNLLIPEKGLDTVKDDMIHFIDDIIVSLPQPKPQPKPQPEPQPQPSRYKPPPPSRYKPPPPNGELYQKLYQKEYITYYSDDKLHNNMQYFIVPNKDIDGLKEKIQPSLTKNINIKNCNITCKFINIDILQPDNIEKYTQLFTSGTITKVFIGDDFFNENKNINNQILSNLLNAQQNNTPELILLPCLYKEKSTNNCDDNGAISKVCETFNTKLINIELYTNFYGDEIVRKSARYDYYFN